MPRPSIDYLSARRAAKLASGGTNYRRRENARAKCDPNSDAGAHIIPLSPEEYERRFKKAEEERAHIAAQKQKLIAEAVHSSIARAANSCGCPLCNEISKLIGMAGAS
jgi:hypothetical protein